MAAVHCGGDAGRARHLRGRAAPAHAAAAADRNGPGVRTPQSGRGCQDGRQDAGGARSQGSAAARAGVGAAGAGAPHLGQRLPQHLVLRGQPPVVRVARACSAAEHTKARGCAARPGSPAVAGAGAAGGPARWQRQPPRSAGAAGRRTYCLEQAVGRGDGRLVRALVQLQLLCSQEAAAEVVAQALELARDALGGEQLAAGAQQLLQRVLRALAPARGGAARRRPAAPPACRASGGAGAPLSRPSEGAHLVCCDAWTKLPSRRTCGASGEGVTRPEAPEAAHLPGAARATRRRLPDLERLPEAVVDLEEGHRPARALVVLPAHRGAAARRAATAVRRGGCRGARSRSRLPIE